MTKYLKGQSFVEYIILISLVAIISIPSISFFGNSIKNTANEIGESFAGQQQTIPDNTVLPTSNIPDDGAIDSISPDFLNRTAQEIISQLTNVDRQAIDNLLDGVPTRLRVLDNILESAHSRLANLSILDTDQRREIENFIGRITDHRATVLNEEITAQGRLDSLLDNNNIDSAIGTTFGIGNLIWQDHLNSEIGRSGSPQERYEAYQQSIGIAGTTLISGINIGTGSTIGDIVLGTGIDEIVNEAGRGVAAATAPTVNNIAWWLYDRGLSGNRTPAFSRDYVFE